jgi:hypothetical protein
MTHTAVVTHHAVAAAHPVESPPSDAWAGVLFLLVVCLMLFLMFKGLRSPAQPETAHHRRATARTTEKNTLLDNVGRALLLIEERPITTKSLWVKIKNPAIFSGVIKMVVRYVAKNGSVVSGPPYTEAEEQDLYRRIAGGPWTVLRTAKTPRTVDPEAAAANRHAGHSGAIKW